MTFVRRAVIFVAQILALISIVVATMAGPWPEKPGWRALFHARRHLARAGYRSSAPSPASSFQQYWWRCFSCASKSPTTREIPSIPSIRERLPSAPYFLVESAANDGRDCHKAARSASDEMANTGIDLLFARVAGARIRANADVERQVKGKPDTNINAGIFATIRNDCTAGPLPAVRLVTPPRTAR